MLDRGGVSLRTTFRTPLPAISRDQEPRGQVYLQARPRGIRSLQKRGGLGSPGQWYSNARASDLQSGSKLRKARFPNTISDAIPRRGQSTISWVWEEKSYPLWAIKVHPLEGRQSRLATGERVHSGCARRRAAGGIRAPLRTSPPGNGPPNAPRCFRLHRFLRGRWIRSQITK